MQCAEGHCSRRAEGKKDDLLCIPAITKSQRRQIEHSRKTWRRFINPHDVLLLQQKLDYPDSIPSAPSP